MSDHPKALRYFVSATSHTFGIGVRRAALFVDSLSRQLSPPSTALNYTNRGGCTYHFPNELCVVGDEAKEYQASVDQCQRRSISP